MKTILVDAWNTFVTENGINLKMQELLDKYPNKKIILTNANDEELVKFGIVNMPYLVFSLKHQPNKTNPDYFKTFLRENKLSSEDVVYFEHNKDAVNSAKSIGIKTLWFKPNTPLDQLKSFLENNL